MKAFSIALATAIPLLAATANAELVGQFVSNDWTGTGAWENRVEGKTDATIAAGTPTLSSAGTLASQAGVNFIDFNGSSFFNVLGNDANNPMYGVGDFSITAVFTTDGNTQQSGEYPTYWWDHGGVVGNERPGGPPADFGLTIDGNIVMGAMSDPRAYVSSNVGNLRSTTTVDDNPVHVVTWVRDVVDATHASFFLYVDGALEASLVNQEDVSAAYDILSTPDLSSGSGFLEGFAIGACSTIGEEKFLGRIAEIQIHDTAIDPTADGLGLHDALVVDGVYQVPEPATWILSLLGIVGLAICRFRKR